MADSGNICLILKNSDLEVIEGVSVRPWPMTVAIKGSDKILKELRHVGLDILSALQRLPVAHVISTVSFLLLLLLRLRIFLAVACRFNVRSLVAVTPISHF